MAAGLPAPLKRAVQLKNLLSDGVRFQLCKCRLLLPIVVCERFGGKDLANCMLILARAL
jgi:hypothetical protein